MHKRTLVIGASTNEDRYSNKAIKALRKHGHEVIAIGNQEGQVADVAISKEKEMFEGIDTITMYVNPKIQESYEEYIISLKPNRVIFNPGTENYHFAKQLHKHGIETEDACTMVLLSIDQY
jgi:uncharacterized protein